MIPEALKLSNILSRIKTLIIAKLAIVWTQAPQGMLILSKLHSHFLLTGQSGLSKHRYSSLLPSILMAVSPGLFIPSIQPSLSSFPAPLSISHFWSFPPPPHLISIIIFLCRLSSVPTPPSFSSSSSSMHACVGLDEYGPGLYNGHELSRAL